MDKMILIVSKNQEESDEIREMLTREDYVGEVQASMEELISRLERGAVLAVLIDIDSIPVDNRCIRKLALKHPSISFFCMSWDKFHPELKDAICYHIYACLNKPIDPDELSYLLRCIGSSDGESQASPLKNGTGQRDIAT